MIPRYQDALIRQIWSDHARYHRWAHVERAVARHQHALGVIPKEAWLAIRDAPNTTAVRVAEYEERLHHDVAAFVAAFSEYVPEEHRRWVHFQITSSDLVDTANAMALRESLGHIARLLDAWIHALRKVEHTHRNTPRLGRTHGQAAQETTFGHQVAVVAEQATRARFTLEHAAQEAKVGKILGPVGRGDKRLSERVCQQLGLQPETTATQIVGRDRYLAVAFALLRVAVAVEEFATEIRLSAHEGVRELAEPFGPEQMGSSSMPHKRNPVRSERLVGLARLARGYFGSMAESVVTWHDRDIAHSSVERVALVDLLHLVAFGLVEAGGLTDDLVVDAGAMTHRLDQRRLEISSQAALSALVRSGVEREAAYRRVQHMGPAIGLAYGSLFDRRAQEANPVIESLRKEATE